MKKIKIKVVFNQWGHGYINIIPSHYAQWNLTESSEREYNLDPGDYTITYNTVTGSGGTIEVIDDETGSEIASSDLNAGIDQGYFAITI